jgi:hypothetical protein
VLLIAETVAGRAKLCWPAGRTPSRLLVLRAAAALLLLEVRGAALALLPLLTAAMLPRSFGAYMPRSRACCQAAKASVKVTSLGSLTLLSHLQVECVGVLD